MFLLAKDSPSLGAVMYFVVEGEKSLEPGLFALCMLHIRYSPDLMQVRYSASHIPGRMVPSLKRDA